MAHSAGHSGRALDNFDDNAVGLRWYRVNDNVMGGRSSGDFVLQEGRLLFFGVLNTNGGGFASIRTEPQQLPIGDQDVFRLRVQGDGRRYQFRLGSAASNAAYLAEFKTEADQWLEIELPLSAFEPSFRGRRLDLPPIDPDAIVSVGFMIADKLDGPFALTVDWIAVGPSGTRSEPEEG